MEEPDISYVDSPLSLGSADVKPERAPYVGKKGCLAVFMHMQQIFLDKTPPAREHELGFQADNKLHLEILRVMNHLSIDVPDGAGYSNIRQCIKGLPL